MSEEKRETVADIVAEMKNGPCNWLTPEGIPQQFHDNELFSEFADRIEAAAKRLAMPTPDQWTEIAKEMCESVLLKRENARLKQRLAQCEKINEQQDIDNARLRAALKPVLDLHSRRNSMTGKEYMASLMVLVRDAQRIYAKSEEKQ